MSISAHQRDDVAFAEVELRRILRFVISDCFHMRRILQRQIVSLSKLLNGCWKRNITLIIKHTQL